jgi:hypothetical protein
MLASSLVKKWQSTILETLVGSLYMEKPMMLQSSCQVGGEHRAAFAVCG